MTVILSDITEFNKVAIRYKNNDFSAWANGVQVATDTSGTIPSGLNELSFDNGAGGSKFYGKTNQVLYFPTRLTDTQLAALTTL